MLVLLLVEVLVRWLGHRQGIVQECRTCEMRVRGCCRREQPTAAAHAYLHSNPNTRVHVYAPSLALSDPQVPWAYTNSHF